MKVKVSKVQAIMTKALKKKGIKQADIPFVINMYLGGELRGHTTHGLAAFAGFINQDFSDAGEPEVIKQTHSLFMIDAKAQSGNIIGRRAADEAIKRAKKEIVGTAIVKNMDKWLRPGAIAEYIADHQMVALVMNSGGGASVAPPGGFDPVTGTNPIAYGIPTSNGSLVVDMATSKRARGQVRLANKYGTDLPADTFYDDHGNVTIDPKQAWSVMPFGEYKGFSLGLFNEIVCGSMLGMPMLINSTSGNSFNNKLPEISGVIIVIEPSQTTNLEAFTKANSELITKIKATRARKGQKIRIPGEQAASEKAAKVSSDRIELPDELWEEINSL